MKTRRNVEVIYKNGEQTTFQNIEIIYVDQNKLIMSQTYFNTSTFSKSKTTTRFEIDLDNVDNYNVNMFEYRSMN